MSPWSRALASLALVLATVLLSVGGTIFLAYEGVLPLPQGPVGPQGPMGPPGPAGSVGQAGSTGQQGVRGFSGTPGADGVDGAAGIGGALSSTEVAEILWGQGVSFSAGGFFPLSPDQVKVRDIAVQEDELPDEWFVSQRTYSPSGDMDVAAYRTAGIVVHYKDRMYADASELVNFVYDCWDEEASQYYFDDAFTNYADWVSESNLPASVPEYVRQMEDWGSETSIDVGDEGLFLFNGSDDDDSFAALLVFRTGDLWLGMYHDVEAEDWFGSITEQEVLEEFLPRAESLLASLPAIPATSRSETYVEFSYNYDWWADTLSFRGMDSMQVRAGSVWVALTPSRSTIDYILGKPSSTTAETEILEVVLPVAEELCPILPGGDAAGRLTCSMDLDGDRCEFSLRGTMVEVQLQYNVDLSSWEGSLTEFEESSGFAFDLDAAATITGSLLQDFQLVRDALPDSLGANCGCSVDMFADDFERRLDELQVFSRFGDYYSRLSYTPLESAEMGADAAAFVFPLAEAVYARMEAA